MTESKKRAALWLCLAIAAEFVILTDALAVWFTGSITTEVAMQTAISYPLIYLLWISGLLIIRTLYERTTTIHFSYQDTPELKHILLGLLLLATATVFMSISWGGLKIYKELVGSINHAGLGLGLANFAAQHVYYCLEVVLMTIIIAFAQEVGEALFKPRWIPYGGIALAVLWGLVHIVWHGPADGLLSTFNALLYGLAFLAMRKNVKFAFVLILLMFIL